MDTPYKRGNCPLPDRRVLYAGSTGRLLITALDSLVEPLLDRTRCIDLHLAVVTLVILRRVGAGRAQRRVLTGRMGRIRQDCDHQRFTAIPPCWSYEPVHIRGKRAMIKHGVEQGECIVPWQVSLETITACGMGACLGCAIHGANGKSSTRARTTRSWT